MNPIVRYKFWITTLFLGVVCMAVPAQGTPVTDTSPASAISKEPFFADVVKRARHLKFETEAFAKKPKLKLLAAPNFKAFVSDIRALSASDLQGHYTLKARGTDNDLKCILTGVSRDLILKIDALEAAKTQAELTQGLTNLVDLLSDNIDVIVTPATVSSGLDCTIEFGKDA